MRFHVAMPVIGALVCLTACNPSDPTQRTVGGGLIGAGSGAAIGDLAGGGRGAAIGALAGGAVGATTGYLTTPKRRPPADQAQDNRDQAENYQQARTQGRTIYQRRYTPQQIVQTTSATNDQGNNTAFRAPYQNGYAPAPNGYNAQYQPSANTAY
ncbi:YMGG-like glycine zipper-containing protein [Komagataeibacter europaeus]|uniref:YMGG-like glycine zipper-containing protein n=1 Tax=Komagataeibacter europaeus TaxID=33995 RepID=UPI000474A260|nr:YMGG-like glycine zipper-containing protein [Komagataeibacter europaeus]GBQ46956.1 hypothetical protein AA18890_2691 [Komagataeibacter europaeus LMG 18890]